MNSKVLYAQHCKLTCLGGSEMGTCECECPNDCKARHRGDFDAADREAAARMRRHLKAGLS
jgi:hypothetical protein